MTWNCTILMNIAVRWVAKIARERKYKKKKQQQFQFVSELHDLMLITHVVGSLLYIYYRTFCSFAVSGQLTSVKLNRKSCWSYYVQAQMVEKRLLVGDNRYITVEGHQAGVGEAKVTKNVEDLSHVCWGLQTSFHLAQPRSATVTIFWQCWSRLLFWWVNDKYFINQPSFATWDFIISPYSDYMHVTANPESSEEWMKKEEAEIPV